ncbi:MAG: hypothetical protein WC272_01070 [Sulfurimonas sp.]|jgi:hypothetical protein
MLHAKLKIHLKTIIDIIEENEEFIQYDYNDKEDLICLQRELTLKLSHFVNKITNEEINKKELLKYALREAFELHKSDIIIIKNNQIFIKLFDNSNIREVSEEEKDTIANRYNGLDEEELKSFYNDFFLKHENKNFFYFVAEQFVDTYMLDKKINNITYEKYVFAFIQSIITEQLKITFDENDDFFKGFSGYVFRIHFKEVFGHIANLILSEMSASNKYIIDFLKYYSLNIVVLSGQKYRVPEIEAPNGLKWNVASMMSIVKIYIKTEVSLGEIRDKIDILEEDIVNYYINGISPVEYNSDISQKIEKIFQSLVYATKRLNTYSDALDSSKQDSQKDVLRADIQKIKHDIQLQKDEKNRLSSKMLNKTQLIKYNNIRREIDSLKRQEKRDEKTLSQNRASFHSIKNSLIKALTSKKVLIEEAN